MLGGNGRSGAPRDRRGFIGLAAGMGLAAGAAAVLGPRAAVADLPPLPRLKPGVPDLLSEDVRQLAFEHLHTGETLAVPYFESGRYVGDALDAVKHIMRDFRDGQEHAIDPGLLDILTVIRGRLGTSSPVLIVSAYRSPETNEMLYEQGGGVAKNSYHVKGKAIDIRLADREPSDVYRIALDLQAGGAGLYENSEFVHVDSGPVRTW